jgi:bacterioferritin-associated ferredoxin
MIVCSCSGVTDRDIRQAIAWMRASDPYALITPGKIYRALGKSAECGGCIRLFVERMRGDDNLAVPLEMRKLRDSGRLSVTEGGRSDPSGLLV